MDIREYTSPTLPVAQFVERYVDTCLLYTSDAADEL